MTKAFEKAIEKFSASYMSNAKWEKLWQTLTDKLGEVHFYFKLIDKDEVRQSSMDIPDSPFFMEPIMHKEVEWVDFPSSYEDYISRDNLKAGKKEYSQDVDQIEEIIRSLGQFLLERSEGSLKLYAYR